MNIPSMRGGEIFEPGTCGLGPMRELPLLILGLVANETCHGCYSFLYATL